MSDPVDGELRRGEREREPRVRDEASSQRDELLLAYRGLQWVIRVLGTVAAGCFILLLVSILRVFV